MGLIARRDESSNKNTAPVGRKENEINWGGGGDGEDWICLMIDIKGLILNKRTGVL